VVERQIGNALALHDGNRRLGTDVAETEHRCAVGDNGHGVLLDRVLEGEVAVFVDRRADPGDAGRVRHRKVVARIQRVLVLHRDLAAAVHLHGAVGVLDHANTADRADAAQDLLPVGLVDRVDRHLAHAFAFAAGSGDQVDADQLAAGARYRGRQFAQGLLAGVEFDPDRDAVLSADCAHPGNYMRPGGRVPTATV
jgi:hypothetical protein